MDKGQQAALVEEALHQEPVKFVCQRQPAVASEATPVVEVLELLQRDRSAAVVVVPETEARGEQGDAPRRPPPTGIFTERDYLDKMAALSPDEWLNVKYNPIRDHMTKRPRVLTAGTRLDEAIQMMTLRGYRHLPIVDDDGGLYGMVSARDVIEYLAGHFPEAVYNQPPARQRDPRFDSREGG